MEHILTNEIIEQYKNIYFTKTGRNRITISNNDKTYNCFYLNDTKDRLLLKMVEYFIFSRNKKNQPHSSVESFTIKTDLIEQEKNPEILKIEPQLSCKSEASPAQLKKKINVVDLKLKQIEHKNKVQY